MGDDLEISKGKKVIPMKLWMVFIALILLGVLQVSGKADVLDGLAKIWGLIVDSTPKVIDALLSLLKGKK